MSYDFSSVFSPNCQYTIHNCIQQYWLDNRFSYTHIGRPDHGILYVIKGKIRFEWEQGSLTANPGDLIFLRKGIHYDACIPPAFGDTEDYLINFDAELPLPPEIPPVPILLLRGENHLRNLFEKIIRNSYWPHNSTLFTLGQFYLLLDTIVTETNTHNEEEKPYLRRARELLSGKKEFSVRQIAQLCNVSESCLRSRFTEAYGLSPKQYRMQVRIEQAKYLLEATDLSLAEIAENLNFYDEAYFCKVFRKFNGNTPRDHSAKKTI